MADTICRWGILSTAGIARKNWKAIRLSGNACVTAVASRDVSKAQRFIDECSQQVPQSPQPEAVGSYEALLEREDVDAVYVPLPTAQRHHWVIQAAEKGKHVLAEKPAALDASQVDEMLAACRSHGVQYMDGVMFMHSQRLPLVRQLLDDPQQIGTLRRLVAQFSFAGDEEFRQHNIRTHSQLEPHGCLGDLGWYCIRIFLWILKGEMPVEVRARTLATLQGNTSPGPVPAQFTAELVFPSGVSASFYNAFVTDNQQWVHASGDRGYLRIDDFVLPFYAPEVAAHVGQDKYVIDNCEFHMEQHLRRYAIREYDAGHQTAQEVNMIRTFSDIVLSGNLDPSWPEWTRKTQQVLDACFRSAEQDGAPVSID
ncbi:MAG: oxidoreductase [Pirellulaceae bacterium]|nr:MAG: oxidoreductase [Pirellulaceae bacterium]